MSEQVNAIQSTATAQAIASAQADEQLLANLQLLNELVQERADSEKAAPVQDAISDLQKAVKDGKNKPYLFSDETYTFSNAIMALGRSINKLLGQQPEIIAADMGISNTLVSSQVNSWSAHWLSVLNTDEQALNNSGLTPQQIAQYQGQLSVDNAASTASSTGLNGVMSMVTQGVSSKTSTYQNLVQQANNVVTALLTFIGQLWVI